MYENIKVAFESLINHSEFQLLLKEYRHRFGIPESGFSDSSSEAYKNWVNEGLRKSDYLKDQFLFFAKRCKNLIPNRDPIPNTLLAYYFLFGQIPIESSNQNNFNFSINPSGILGSLDITFTVPLVFSLDEFSQEVEKHNDEINQTSENIKLALSNLSNPKKSKTPGFDSTHDLLATTPGNGSDIVDRVHRDMAYLVELGRIGLHEHLQNMREEDFIVNTYDDKNKPMFAPIRNMGMFLMNRGLFAISEEYWKQIDDEVQLFNSQTGKRVNRGIPLANTGVSQIAQGKVIEGLFNIYRGYYDDKECLKHLSNITIDPEEDMANSILFTQFEKREIDTIFGLVTVKFNHIFDSPFTISDLGNFIQSLNSDKKLLLYIILYRFSFSFNLNNELSTIISRSEILRSLSELVLWFEDELKRKNTKLKGQTLGEILGNKIRKLNTKTVRYTESSSLKELKSKIVKSIKSSKKLEFSNARVVVCLRNFAGHNLEVQEHSFFNMCGEIFARTLSLIIYSKNKNWI